jgi:hypothetical protein
MSQPQTELCKLAMKWTTDKAIFYTPFYDELLRDRREQTTKVLELGIGFPECMGHISRIGLSNYITGASLFMWEEYFPNAEIFGLDNDPRTFINQGRIKSFYVHQGNEASYAEAIANIGRDFDLIIDDGAHYAPFQLLACKMLVPLLKKGGIYIMEDLVEPYEIEPLSQIPYPYELKKFHRPELPNNGWKTAAVAVIRNT